MDRILFVGMDVDKEGIDLAGFEIHSSGSVYEKRIVNEPGKIAQEMNRLKSAGMVLHTCYEAGPCGFDLKRLMDRLEIRCIVVSPGLVPRRPTDRIKTNRRDARILGRMLRAGEVEAIHVPTPLTESVRDFIRCREDLKDDHLRRRHRLSKFLLRHGKIYPGTPWTSRHRLWVKSLKWGQEALRETFDQYLFAVEEVEERLKRCDDRIAEYALRDPWKEAVGNLRCFRGVDTLTAMGVLAEIEDFRRFPTARNFMSYLGLAVSEHSTGGTHRRGGITKSGNGHVRRLLVEAAWQYRHKPVLNARLRLRRQGRQESVIRLADRAMERLHRRFHRLVNRGKRSTVAVVAVARELAGFIWASQTLCESVQ